MHSAKQFLRMKPDCYGCKLWTMAGIDGYPYALEIYTRKSSGEVTRLLGFRVVVCWRL
jgi:hypothetical protein